MLRSGAPRGAVRRFGLPLPRPASGDPAGVAGTRYLRRFHRGSSSGSPNRPRTVQAGYGPAWKGACQGRVEHRTDRYRGRRSGRVHSAAFRWRGWSGGRAPFCGRRDRSGVRPILPRPLTQGNRRKHGAVRRASPAEAGFSEPVRPVMSIRVSAVDPVSSDGVSGLTLDRRAAGQRLSSLDVFDRLGFDGAGLVDGYRQGGRHEGRTNVDERQERCGPFTDMRPGSFSFGRPVHRRRLAFAGHGRQPPGLACFNQIETGQQGRE